MLLSLLSFRSQISRLPEVEIREVNTVRVVRKWEGRGRGEGRWRGGKGLEEKESEGKGLEGKDA